LNIEIDVDTWHAIGLTRGHLRKIFKKFLKIF